MKLTTLSMIIIMLFCSIYSQDLPAQQVDVWLTTSNQSKKLAQQQSLSFSSSSNNQTPIWINENTTYQVMDGFGAAMTGSSAYIINQTMSSSQRNALMDDLFSSSGIRLSFVRHSIGASDFDLSSFTYNDRPNGQTDLNLNFFSINQDRADLIPMLKLAKQKNSGLKIMGTPWSAPAWMKENNNLNGGWLNTNYYQVYANYLVKYMQAYATEGLPIYAITLQNEPLHETSSYPSMRMDAGNQISFVNNNLGPQMASNGLSTKLIAYDHNWDEPNYPIDVMNNGQAKSYIAGSAFHAYAGTPDAQTTVHNAHPDKGIWFTELSGGDWSSNFGNNLRWKMSNIVIGSTRNWAKSVLLWNLALDQNDGPQNGGCTNCRGVVTINNGNVTKEVEYYVLGHISKFVDAGAVRIESNTYSGGIENVVFKNPNGSKVMIALNNGNSRKQFAVNWNGKSFNYSLAAGAVATFTWTDQVNTSPIGQTIWLRGTNNKYVSSQNGNAPMTCDRNSPSGWEQFTVVDAGNGLIALRGSNNRYVSSENGNAPMICNRTGIGGWERFEWISQANGQIALKGSNQQYVSSENGTAPMQCNRATIGGWEVFNYGIVNQNTRLTVSTPSVNLAQQEAIIYPNPLNLATHHTLSIQLNKQWDEEVNLQLFDMQGKELAYQTFFDEKDIKWSLDSKLKSGVYIVKIRTGALSFTQKLVIQ